METTGGPSRADVGALDGRGTRVRIYFGERDRYRGKPLWAALLETLRREGAAGATVTRGLAGYGAHSVIHAATLVDLSADLPLVVEWVDAAERVERLLPGLLGMLTGCLVTTDPVEIRRYTPHPGAARDAGAAGGDADRGRGPEAPGPRAPYGAT
jgi:PII-like signaling protein